MTDENEPEDRERSVLLRGQVVDAWYTLATSTTKIRTNQSTTTNKPKDGNSQ